MKRYVLKEKEADSCSGCFFDNFGNCPTWPCGRMQREDKKNIIFVFEKTEEIEEE